MSNYIIGDVHLSLGVDKPMDIYGGEWIGYVDKLRQALSALTPDDTLVLAGDISWGMRLTETLPDFMFLTQHCKAEIILVKGNHDYWWTTVAKMNAFLSEQGLVNLKILHNNAYLVDGKAICGTRGWFYEEDKGADAQNEKVFLRELGRLRASLEAGRRLGAEELICCLHYPPLYEGYRCDPIVELMGEYGVRRCYYGHLHGQACGRAIEGVYRGIDYTLVSADHVGFTPVKIL